MPADLTVSIAGTPVPVYLGENTAESARQALLAAGSAEDAALSAATAEAASGPTYASTAAGLAATTNGQAFAVDAGGGLVSVYLNSAGTAVLQRTLATTDYLASSAGAGAIGRYTVPTLIASTQSARGVGEIWYADEFRYQEAASGATDHHITTAAGVKLYALPNSDGFISAAAFGFATTASASANHAAIKAAVAAAQAIGCNVSLPQGAFNIDPAADLGIPVDPTISIVISGAGRGITTLTSTRSCFKIAQDDADAVASTTVTANIGFKDRTLTVASTAGFAVGQLIRIVSTENMEETNRTYKKQYVSEVKSIDSGTSLTLRHPAPCGFTASGNTITIRGFAIAPIAISNATLIGTKTLPVVGASAIVMTKHAADVTVDCDYHEKDNSDLLNPAQDGSAPLLDGVSAMRSLRVISRNAKQSYLVYGFIAQEGSADCELVNALTLNCRHSNNFGVGSHGCRVDTAIARDCYAGFDSHETAFDSEFVNCRSTGSEIETKLRGRRDVCRGCRFTDGLTAEVDPGVRTAFPYNTAVGKTLEKLFYDCEIDGAGKRLLAVATRLGFYGGSIANTLLSATGGMYVDFLDLIDVAVDGENANNIISGGTGFAPSAAIRTRVRGVTALGPDAGVTATDARATDQIFVYHNTTGASVDVSGSLIDGWRSGVYFNVSGDQQKSRIYDNDFLNNGDGVRFVAAATQIGKFTGNAYTGNFANITNVDRPYRSIDVPDIRENTFTAANILSAAHEVNTKDKYLGKMVVDRSNNRIMIATGSAATSNWSVADGSASVTPA